ncbi:MAG: hypothetical protein ABSA75_05045 [Candidatus Bathyarchaeia archaeon]|jgi:hypothetical protein
MLKVAGSMVMLGFLKAKADKATNTVTAQASISIVIADQVI